VITGAKGGPKPPDESVRQDHLVRPGVHEGIDESIAGRADPVQESRHTAGGSDGILSPIADALWVNAEPAGRLKNEGILLANSPQDSNSL
jgi:hypothetical protein